MLNRWAFNEWAIQLTNGGAQAPTSRDVPCTQRMNVQHVLQGRTEEHQRYHQRGEKNKVCSQKSVQTKSWEPKAMTSLLIVVVFRAFGDIPSLRHMPSAASRKKTLARRWIKSICNIPFESKYNAKCEALGKRTESMKHCRFILSEGLFLRSTWRVPVQGRTDSQSSSPTCSSSIFVIPTCFEKNSIPRGSTCRVYICGVSSCTQTQSASVVADS